MVVTVVAFEQSPKPVVLATLRAQIHRADASGLSFLPVWQHSSFPSLYSSVVGLSRNALIHFKSVNASARVSGSSLPGIQKTKETNYADQSHSLRWLSLVNPEVWSYKVGFRGALYRIPRACGRETVVVPALLISVVSDSVAPFREWSMLALAEEVLGGVMASAFEPWIGQLAVVQVAFGEFKLRLPGTLLKDQGETLLIRPQCGPDLQVSKAKVLAIEECACPRNHASDPENGRLQDGAPLPHRSNPYSSLMTRLNLGAVSRNLFRDRSVRTKHVHSSLKPGFCE
jgi:hypothetical protein